MSLPIYQRVAVTDAGDVIPGAEYTVINENTGVAAPIYSDRTGATLLTAPYFADSVGTIQFYIAAGTTFRVAASGGVGTYTDRYVYAAHPQSSATDPTSGSLMAVGAWGLGGLGLVVTDANTALRPGFYCGPGASGVNYFNAASGQYGTLLVEVRQVLQIMQTNTFGNRSAKRESLDQGVTWTGWNEIITADAAGNVGIGGNINLSANDTYVGFPSNGIYYNNSADNISVKTAAFERMRIDNAGNALFGKTSVTIGNAGLVIGTPAAGVTASVPSGSNSYHVYKTGAGAGYTFYVSSTGTVNYVALNQLSDEREKKNIIDVPHGISTVMNLKPRQFDWKDGEQADGVFGFIAQEVETVLPSLIGEYKKDEGVTRKSLSQVELIPVLTKAIQEQQALIEALTARVEALEAK